MGNIFHSFKNSQSVYNMKRLGFRAASVSTEEKAGARTKALQTTESQLFLYCELCRRALF